MSAAVGGLKFDHRPRSKTTMIILHDSHTDPKLPSTTAYLRTRGRQLGLLDVGYHFVIERDGTIIPTRAMGTIGSHCIGLNHVSVGICLAGGLTGADDFTCEQMRSCGALVRHLRQSYGEIPVKGHSEVASAMGRRGRCICPAFDIETFREDYMDNSTIDLLPPLEPATEGSSLSPQNTMLLEYLKSGKEVTNLVAIGNLGLGSLSSRIAELRKAGHKIKGEEKRDFHKRRYVSYSYDLPDAEPV